MMSEVFCRILLHRESARALNNSSNQVLRLLVQKVDIWIDRGLVKANLSLFNSEKISIPDTETSISKLHKRVIITEASKKKNVYQDLHISPPMVRNL